MTSAPAEMIVIGGGVVGSSIAYHLARAGVRTTLLERWTVGAAASGASAGGVRQQGRDPREMSLAIAAAARWKNLEAELDADLAYHRNGHLNVITRDADRAALEAMDVLVENIAPPHLQRERPQEVAIHREPVRHRHQCVGRSRVVGEPAPAQGHLGGDDLRRTGFDAGPTGGGVEVALHPWAVQVVPRLMDRLPPGAAAQVSL